MKTLVMILLVLILVGLSAISTSVLAQREVPNRPQPNNRAPAASLAVFQNFFSYVRKSKPDIVTDEAAQNRWLTQRMRNAFLEYVKRSGDPKENPGYPSNQTFVCVWNNPTNYTIVGSRHYDHHNKQNPNDNRVIIDVLYEWDPRIDDISNQYRGEKQLHSFVFIFEDKKWKLDDIYTFEDVYTSTESLKQYFQQH